MKRAAIGVLAIAALVLLGSPSAPLPDGSSCFASTSKLTAVPGAIAPSGGGPQTGGSDDGESGGGTTQGDADGLSGLKVTPRSTQPHGGSFVTVERVMVLFGPWWKLMIWMR
jgi:hypothetical protein